MSQFPAVIDLATLDGVNGFRLDGINFREFSGRSVASAGDVNGDGFDDVIVGAPFVGPGGQGYAGRSYVVFGKSTGFAASIDFATLDGGNGFRLEGIDDLDYSGWSVAGAGDVNGDGFDDLIIGARRAAPNGDDGAGESYVVFGKASGFAARIKLANLNGSNGFRLDGVDEFEQSGWSVAAAGDVNGDGFADLLIGALSGSSAGRIAAGESYVVFGKAGGFAAALDLASLDGSNGFRLDGVDNHDYSGVSVAGAGDVNGDGFDDLIIGAHHGDPGGDSQAGESYVVFGKGNGFAATIDLAGLDGSNGFRIDGIDPSDHSGFSVAGAGDVNGDGFDDLIVGAPDAGPSGAGESYVVFGAAGGFAAALDLAGLDGSNGFRIGGVNGSDHSGFSVAGAGDVNGDGFADLIVGAPFADPSASGDGYVLFGKASGFSAAFDLSSLDGDNGFRIDGHGGSGFSVAAAGDVNGDGFADLIIGAPEGDGGGPYAGESYVVFGIKPTDPVNRTGTDIGQRISGGLGADTLSGLGGDDTLFGNENDDTLNGGEGDDVIDGGSGNDAMAGGTGDDLYFVDAAGDTVAELVNQGTDEVRTSVDYTLGSHVEHLSMTGTAAIDGTGNGIGNTMTGNSGANELTGLGGSDRLDGQGGADRMSGGTGNEIYFVDNAGDKIFELAGEGTDQVRSAISFSLTVAANVENLLLTGTGAINGAGDAGANTLLGGTGNNTLNGREGDDVLNGGFGRDSLIGGLGADRFVYFNNAAQSGITNTTRDLIQDFVSGTDTLDLSLMDANLVVAGDQAFVIDGNGSFSTAEIKIEDIGTDLLLSFNIDADAAAEMQIQVRNINSVVAGDFDL